MKKGLIYLLLFFSLAATAQLPGVVASQGVSSSGYCAEYQAVYNAMTNKPTALIAAAQNTFVVAAKAHSYWTKLVIFYGLAQYSNNAGEAYINWVTPGTYDLTDPGSTAPTFTSLEGIAGDASSDYLSTNWTPSTQGGIYTQNSASYGAYVRNALNAGYTFGGYGSNSNHVYFAPRLSGTVTWRINDQANVSATSATSVGFWTINRVAADSSKCYKNGALFSANAATSSGLPNVALYVCARNANGSAGTFSSLQMSCVFFGSGLTTTDIANLNTDWEAYMDSNSKGIQ